VQAGNVMLKAASWNRDFLDEHETFPGGKRKDIVDAAAGAFNKLAAPALGYDTSLAWIDGTPL
jgi:phage terminase large subunit-like protein